MKKAFIFDLDGVITETASLHYLAWKQEVKRIGIDLTPAENSTLKGMSRIDTLKAILKNHKMDQRFKPEEILVMATRKNEHYLEMLKTQLSEDAILPGIVDLLIEAKKRGIKLAVASSSHSAPLILEKLKIKNYFDYIVDPGIVKQGKPAPDIYLLACKGLGVTPSQAIGFEDAIIGVKGLVDGKIKCVAITHGEPGDWAIADLVVKSTRDLKIEQILKL